jgi:hypothetical protein
MTYGDLKFRLSQMFPGVSLDIIEGFINDRYAEVLGELPWSRLNVQAVLSLTAPYTTGTVAVTQGSASIALTGGAWDSTMTGRGFRVAGQSEYYQFSFSSSTAATLDRPFEGVTAAAAGYSVFQAVYPLPADCRLLEGNCFAAPGFGELTRTTHVEIDAFDPGRLVVGAPTKFAVYMDDSNAIPPQMQVEVWPVPNVSMGLPFTYASDAGDLASTTTVLQAWLQPAALVEGSIGKIKAFLKDYTGAAFHGVAAKAALMNMRTSEAQGLAPAKMQLDSYYTRHRTKRWCR